LIKWIGYIFIQSWTVERSLQYYVIQGWQTKDARTNGWPWCQSNG